MRLRILILPVAALALGVLGTGCAEREQVKSRYVTTAVEDVFSPIDRAGWTGDRQVYEIPAAPPAVADLHRARTCKTPGQQFKSPTMFNLVEEDSFRPEKLDPQILAKADDLHWVDGPRTRPIYTLVTIDPSGGQFLVPSSHHVDLAAWQSLPEPIPRHRQAYQLSVMEVIDDPCVPKSLP